MSANPPTRIPEAPAAAPSGENPAEQKLDRFRPEMPQIPGVTSASSRVPGGFGAFDSQRILQIAGISAAVVLLAGFIFWRAKSKPNPAASTPLVADDTEQPAPAPEPALVVQPPDATNVAANVDQLSQPWASRKFTFVNPLTQESIPAMVIRLPSEGLWAFSLQAPYGRCELDFVTDVAAIAAKYRYKASHPMVVNPCDGAVYDPLKVGPLDGNTWARGGIVKGNSLRPPISIDVKLHGRTIVADGIE